jgi:hypothetical protein
MYQSDVLVGLEKTLIIVGLATGYSAIVFLVLTSLGTLTGKAVARIPLLCLVAFIFGTLALSTGMITASSREAAVGDVLPAALGLIGAVALYVFTKVEREAPLAATAVASFAILLLLGTLIGSYERARAVDYLANHRFDKKQLIDEANLELLVNGYRAHIGLQPLDFSKMAATSPDKSAKP